MSDSYTTEAGSLPQNVPIVAMYMVQHDTPLEQREPIVWPDIAAITETLHAKEQADELAVLRRFKAKVRKIVEEGNSQTIPDRICELFDVLFDEEVSW